jgi:hypothetical protein
VLAVTWQRGNMATCCGIGLSAASGVGPVGDLSDSDVVLLASDVRRCC